MADMVFTKGVDTFTWTYGRAFPLRDPAKVNVVVDYSEGGQAYAYDKGIEEKLFVLKITGATQTDYDNFDDWLRNIVTGPKETFTFTDIDGTDHTVRLMDTENQLQEADNGYFEGTITLRKEVT